MAGSGAEVGGRNCFDPGAHRVGVCVWPRRGWFSRASRSHSDCNARRCGHHWTNPTRDSGNGPGSNSHSGPGRHLHLNTSGDIDAATSNRCVDVNPSADLNGCTHGDTTADSDGTSNRSAYFCTHRYGHAGARDPDTNGDTFDLGQPGLLCRAGCR